MRDVGRVAWWKASRGSGRVLLRRREGVLWGARVLDLVLSNRLSMGLRGGRIGLSEGDLLLVDLLLRQAKLLLLLRQLERVVRLRLAILRLMLALSGLGTLTAVFRVRIRSSDGLLLQARLLLHSRSLISFCSSPQLAVRSCACVRLRELGLLELSVRGVELGLSASEGEVGVDC